MPYPRRLQDSKAPQAKPNAKKLNKLKARNSCLEVLSVVPISEYDELMIPQEKSAAVWRGLDEAFGTSSIEDTRRMTRGLSSDLVLRIVVGGSPYLLRIMTRMDERNDPARVFACMKAAAEAGLAPRVLYSNEAEGIAIIDWIETECSSIPTATGASLSSCNPTRPPPTAAFSQDVQLRHRAQVLHLETPHGESAP